MQSSSEELLLPSPHRATMDHPKKQLCCYHWVDLCRLEIQQGFSKRPYAVPLQGGLRPPSFTGKSQGQRPCESVRYGSELQWGVSDSIASWCRENEIGENLHVR